MSDLAKTNHFDPLTEGEREELTAPIETTHDMYTEDTLADPEGAKARTEYVAEYPSFVYDNFTVSDTDIFGNKFKDGKQHLCPTKTFLDEIIRCHEEGEAHVSNMIQLAQSEEQERINSLVTNYGDIVRNNPYEEYTVIDSVKRITEEKLANRAYTKHLYYSLAEKEERTGQPIPGNFNADVAFGVMQDAALQAGVWYPVWEEVMSASDGWHSKNDVQLNIEYAVKKLAQRKADKQDANHRTEKARVPSTADYKAAVTF